MIKNTSLLIGYAVILLLCSCNNSKKELDNINKKIFSQETSIDIKSYLSQSGILKARLSAPLMIRYTSDSVRVEFPKTLHTEFFLDSKTNPQSIDTNIVESHIYANYGRYTESNNKVYLKDSVLCFNSIKKDTLWCDDLWWDQEQQKIYTWGKFRFKSHDGEDMRGDGKETGFTAMQDLSEYTLYKSKGVMVAPPGSLPQ
jgi:hypothetical protein